jgi:Exostosin family
MYEAIQLGCIPIYIWEEEIMLPFTEFIDWNSFSIIIEAKNIDQLGQRLKEADVAKLQAGVEEVRHMMTYKYTLQYIIAYLHSGMPGYPGEYFKTMPAGVATF